MTAAGTLLKKELDSMKTAGRLFGFVYDRVSEDLYSVLLDKMQGEAFAQIDNVVKGLGLLAW